jgi:uncharacterized protein (DUF2235 family)
VKRIIICADGTWNEPERRDKQTGRMYPTNVLKIARAAKPHSSTGVEQVIYYRDCVPRSPGLCESVKVERSDNTLFHEERMRLGLVERRIFRSVGNESTFQPI